MVIQPEGLTPWQRSASIETIGGHTDKQNVQGLTAFNPKTQVSAEQFSSLADYVIAALRTIPFATLNVTTNDTSPANPTVNNYWGQHGTGSTLAPTCTRLGDGYFSVAWDASYEDSYSQTGSVNLSAAQVSVECVGDVRPVTYWFAGSTTLYVQVFMDLGSTSATDATVTVSVW